MRFLTIACAALLLAGCGAPKRLPAADPPLNVLFIISDDLNDWVGCLGNRQAKTPHIDRLARSGVLFTNAHAQAPICNPSRTSFLTGLRPSTTGVYVNEPNYRSVEGFRNAVSMPEHFATNGYVTMGVGKVFHCAYANTDLFHKYGPRPGYGPLPKPKLNYPTGHPLWDWGAYPPTEAESHDQMVADWAVEQIGKDHGKPFFLAVGFYRPHVPMYAPPKWFDEHPLDKVQLPPVLDSDRDDLPQYAKELTTPDPAPPHRWFVENHQWEHAVQSYLASVSFMDDKVGQVLAALEKSPHAKNTIVVFLGDQGWHLGEKKRWAKRSLWERSTRVPLIVSAPGMPAGARCGRPVGLIDLYPTLVELCELKPKADLEGTSLRPLLDDPKAEWERPALTTFCRNNHAVRTERWRYIRYADGSEELYDHRNDPNEWHNLAGEAEHDEVKKSLAAWMPRVNSPDHAPPAARNR